MARVNKTQKTEASVSAFIDAMPDATKREDCRVVAKIMEKATTAKGKMWGPSIVGFGDRQYVGRTGPVDWIVVGFSPRKAALTLYIMGGIDHKSTLFKQLGKYKTSGGCLYIKRLSDVDVGVLEKIIKESVALLTKAKPKAKAKTT